MGLSTNTKIYQQREKEIKEAIQTVQFIGDKVKSWLLGEQEINEFENECKVIEGWRYTKYFGFIPYEMHYSFLKVANIGLVNYLP